jgi:hypothetical protein
MPYHFIIDDPSGNSYVQNPHAPAGDVYVSAKYYERTRKDMNMMGFVADDDDEKTEQKEEEKKEDSEEHKESKKPDFTPQEVEQMMKLAKKREADGFNDKSKDDEREYTSANFDFTKSIDEQSKDIGNINNEAFLIPLP